MNLNGVPPLLLLWLPSPHPRTQEPLAFADRERGARKKTKPHLEVVQFTKSPSFQEGIGIYTNISRHFFYSGSPLPRTLASLSEPAFGGEGLGVETPEKMVRTDF